MSIVKQPSNGKGSLKNIQLLVNSKSSLINAQIISVFPELSKHKITWVSPLSTDNFSEYRDDDFIVRVGLDKAKINLKSFWPNQGPQWDALAKTDKGAVILVEAKANVPEVVSPGTSASPASKRLITQSLEETKQYLGIKNNIDWSGTFYQYTNRLAHLYYLRSKGVKAYLVNIYFTGDKSVNGPATKEEWEAALTVINKYLGLGSRYKLKKYCADLFTNSLI